MKFFPSSLTLPALVAAACVALPAASRADHKVTVYRDRDGDGHYNKKTYDVRGHGHDHGSYYRGYGGHYGGYDGGYYGGSRYYGRPYSNYGYYRPYYGPSVGLSFYTEPEYYTESTVYRSAPASSYGDSLASDVQRALRRHGYYSGPVDGDIGPGSRAAIRAYQAARGLAVTGRIDTSLIRSLGVG